MKRNSQQGQGDDKKHSGVRPSKKKSQPWPITSFEVNQSQLSSNPFSYDKEPEQVGYFSLYGEPRYHEDQTQLRYYKSPNEKFEFNLGDGYDPEKSDEVQEMFLLHWISQNRPKFKTLNPNFVGPRGHFTKLLCIPYETETPWKMAATLYGGTIYLSEVETQTLTDRDKEMSYWGKNFENYVTEPNKELEENGAFYSIVSITGLEGHSILCSAEVDCCDGESKSAPPANYIELKTNSKKKKSPRRQGKQDKPISQFKFLRIWAQSFLAGVPKVVVGMRDANGIVDHVDTYKTEDIPSEVKNWNVPKTLNFLNKFLGWLKQLVVKDDPNVVYMLEFKYPFKQVNFSESSDESKSFLPEEYVKSIRK